MIEKDGPIVDSPVGIELGEQHPKKSPQDVGVFAFVLIPRRRYH